MLFAPYSAVWLLLLAAPVVWFLPAVVRRLLMIALPLCGLVALYLTPNGEWGQVEFLGQSLLLVRLDDLARIFVCVFLIGALMAGIFAWRQKERLEQVSALAYGGGAIAAVCAGDLLTLFIFWEVVGLASTILILSARGADSYGASFRYLMMQLCSGLALLSGFLLSTDSGFNALDPTTLAGVLILFACGVKAAFPLLHFWLPDVYPRATATATIFLSIFSTKLGIYALVRGFAGVEWLIYIGMVMAIMPALFALAENNLRRALSYALISQLGFMVAAVGIGTPLALNGAVAHAFASVIYQSLLFMIVGTAILYGKLGRAYLILCLVGGASIAGMPFFIGFATKSLTIAAAITEGWFVLWLVLLAANAMAVIHTSIRLPALLFFNGDTSEATGSAPPDESKRHTLIATGLAATICLTLGLYPQLLYALLPFENSYSPFDWTHITGQLQLIVFASIAAFFFVGRKETILLDLDWLWRGLPYLLYKEMKENIAQGQRRLLVVRQALTLHGVKTLRALFRQNGFFAGSQATGVMVLWIAIFLFAVMVLALII